MSLGGKAAATALETQVKCQLSPHEEQIACLKDRSRLLYTARMNQSSTSLLSEYGAIWHWLRRPLQFRRDWPQPNPRHQTAARSRIRPRDQLRAVGSWRRID